MEPTAAARDSAEIRVGTRCGVQTLEDRFGAHVLDDMKAFLYHQPGENAAIDESDESDDVTGSSIGSAFSQASGPAVDEDAFFPDPADTDATFPTASPLQNGQPNPRPGFPPLQRMRCNLTALSQQYNLYFAAYADKIYVYQPNNAPGILPDPSVILTPRKCKAAKMAGAAIDSSFPHQMNSIVVGNLGDLEILCFAFDDGDVGAYYTHTIAQCIAASSGHFRSTGGSVSRNAVPKQFFHDNVGLSAWGLAIHQQSRLVAVSSNRAEVTVFAFATTENPCQSASINDDVSPTLPDGMTAWELEKHFQSRTRTWRIILSTGPGAANIPSIAFADDETGYAEKVLAYDICKNTWIMDIWTLGAMPIHLSPLRPRAPSLQTQTPQIGWGILVLPDSSFMRVETASELLGVPKSEVITAELLHGQVPLDHYTGLLNDWLDTTCSLYYIRDFAPNVDAMLQQRYQLSRYWKTHADARSMHGDNRKASVRGTGDCEVESEMSWGESDDGAEGSDQKVFISPEQHEQRWRNFTKSVPGIPSPVDFKDLSGPTQLSRVIVPTRGLTTPVRGTATQIMDLSINSLHRNCGNKPIDFAKGGFSPHITKRLTMLRVLSTDIELQPLDERSAGTVCRGVLTHHNHQGRRTSPWDLERSHSERITMLLHVPELNLVVAGSLNGRVALITLTKGATHVREARVRRSFRVDWVLPRRAEEEKRLRPWCTLHGIAVSPVPDPKARGLDLHRRRGKAPHGRFRLIMHYLDHTILTYDIWRHAGSDELMIF